MEVLKIANQNRKRVKRYELEKTEMPKSPQSTAKE
jgi:hypothetical protein